VDRDLSVVNRRVRDKIVGGYKLYCEGDEGDQGREKSTGRFRVMRIMGI
jgi:hypothetical protein